MPFTPAASLRDALAPGHSEDPSTDAVLRSARAAVADSMRVCGRIRASLAASQAHPGLPIVAVPKVKSWHRF